MWQSVKMFLLNETLLLQQSPIIPKTCDLLVREEFLPIGLQYLKVLQDINLKFIMCLSELKMEEELLKVKNENDIIVVAELSLTQNKVNALKAKLFLIRQEALFFQNQGVECMKQIKRETVNPLTLTVKEYTKSYYTHLVHARFASPTAYTVPDIDVALTVRNDNVLCQTFKKETDSVKARLDVVVGKLYKANLKLTCRRLFSPSNQMSGDSMAAEAKQLLQEKNILMQELDKVYFKSATLLDELEATPWSPIITCVTSCPVELPIVSLQEMVERHCIQLMSKETAAETTTTTITVIDDVILLNDNSDEGIKEEDKGNNDDQRSWGIAN